MRLLLLFSVLIFSIQADNTTWSINDDFAVAFSTTKAVGTFKEIQGDIMFQADQLAKARFDVWVATASIATGNKTKDKHARGAKWLHAEEHPKISFKSTAFQATADGYQVEGALSIRGISKTVSIPFTFEHQVFSGSLKIDRQAYGIKGPFLFGGMVGDEIEVTLNIPVSQQP